MADNNMSRRKFITVAGTGAVAVALSGLWGCTSGSSANSSTSGNASSSASAAGKVDDDLASMTWEQVLAEAKGQTVTFLAWGSGGADAFVQQYWDQLAEQVKSKYDVTIEYTEFDQAAYEKISTDLSTPGVEATFDMFWNTGAMTAPVRAAADGQGTFDGWLDKLPNYKYLDPTNAYVTFDGAQSTDNQESPFQGLNPSLVYSANDWDAKLAYNATEGSKRGLPHNFTELAEWVKLNPGKFSYMDLTGKGSFHGLFFLKAILAELTDDGDGGWRAVYEEADSATVRREKINANIKQWYDWSTSSSASEEAFYEKAAYLWAYLNELAPSLMQGDAGASYVQTAPDMMSYVKAGDLAVTFTTCTQVANRVESAPDSYMENPAIYMLQTSVGAWDYNVIMSNAARKAGALVVCNEMIDPVQQLVAFETTGNGYNVAYGKLDSENQKKFDDSIAKMGELSPSSEEIEQKSYTDMFGNVAKWISSGWAQKVNA